MNGEEQMKKEIGRTSKSIYALFFAILLCLGIFSPTASIVVAADEIAVPEATSIEVVKKCEMGRIRTGTSYTSISSSFEGQS